MHQSVCLLAQDSTTYQYTHAKDARKLRRREGEKFRVKKRMEREERGREEEAIWSSAFMITQPNVEMREPP